MLVPQVVTAAAGTPFDSRDLLSAGNARSQVRILLGEVHPERIAC